MSAMQVAEERPEYRLDETVRLHSANIRWDRELKNNLKRRREITYSTERVLETQYRPFVKQYCYVEYIFVSNKYQMDSIFPMPDGENRAICVPGVGSTKPFSVLVTDSMPDLELISKGQCFPRYRYQAPSHAQTGLPGLGDDLRRFDNITDTTLRKFRSRYQDPSITKDAVFGYVYGLLHAPSYRERFANDLNKTLPRIPLAQDFHASAQAGNQLTTLHLGYETCAEHPLELNFTGEGAPRPEHFRIGKQRMRFADAAKSELIINDHIRLTSIPAEAHQYEVNGRTPLEWLIDRYRVTQDTHSGIVNDPNAWFDQPQDLIATFRRIVHLSVVTTRIVAQLPSLE